MPLYAVRLFYLGTNYHGSQFQPGLDTVQGRLIDAVSRWEGVKHDTKSVRFSGRTDRGVHSLGQLVTVRTNTPLDIDQVNRHLPQDVTLWAYTRISESFNPRHNVLLRHYRYYLETEDTSPSLPLMRQAAQKLVGTNNYSLLSKPDSDRTAYATLPDISLTRNGSVIIFDVYGTNFLWKQVRKIVSLLNSIGNGEIEPQRAEQVIARGWKPPGGIRPAPEEGLILMEVIVNFSFRTSRHAINRIRKLLNHKIGFLTRTLVTMTGLTNDVSFYQYPFY
ncbi:tRNA pseudouridine(38-40) synthase TruA [Candidatus Thorarchaeota archaeon]|nr:MAG: tRNA pseudouridine(38-40) synthase TruA [Candidatus Thorarchaeota archaeon]